MICPFTKTNFIFHPTLPDDPTIRDRTHILVSGISKLGNMTTTTKIFPKVLRYKWEAYCNTNGRRTAIQMGGVLTVFPFRQSVGAPKVLQCKLEAYCNTNWRCVAILFLRSSGGWGFWRSSDKPVLPNLCFATQVAFTKMTGITQVRQLQTRRLSAGCRAWTGT